MKRLLVIIGILCLSLTVIQAQNPGDKADTGYSYNRSNLNSDTGNFKPPFKLAVSAALPVIQDAQTLNLFDNYLLVGEAGNVARDAGGLVATRSRLTHLGDGAGRVVAVGAAIGAPAAAGAGAGAGCSGSLALLRPLPAGLVCFSGASLETTAFARRTRVFLPSSSSTVTLSISISSSEALKNLPSCSNRAGWSPHTSPKGLLRSSLLMVLTC